MARPRERIRPSPGERCGSVSGGSGGIHPEMALLVEGKRAMNAAATPSRRRALRIRPLRRDDAAAPSLGHAGRRPLLSRGRTGGRDAGAALPSAAGRVAGAVHSLLPRWRIHARRPRQLGYRGLGQWPTRSGRTSSAWTIASHRDIPFPPRPRTPSRCCATSPSNAAELGIDVDRIGTWGDSAGGNLATVTCLMSRDRGGPPVRAQVLVAAALSDVLDCGLVPHPLASPPGLTTEAVDYFWGQYLGDRRPFAANPTRPRSRPKTCPACLRPWCISPRSIPLADDGRRYAERLRAAGVDDDSCGWRSA